MSANLCQDCGEPITEAPRTLLVNNTHEFDFCSDACRTSFAATCRRISLPCRSKEVSSMVQVLTIGTGGELPVKDAA